jgi:predicted hotdog family 3-hydroxylacyl-ACP dehydratase
LSTADAGGKVTFAGQDPIIAARHRLGAAIGIPLMGNAVAAAAMHRHRGGPSHAHRRFMPSELAVTAG